MKNFIWLIFAHYFGDVALQSTWQSINKAKIIYVMICHCMVWTACISIALQYLNIFSLWKVVFLFVGHFLMDTYKVKGKTVEERMRYIYPDQIFHILQCVVVYVS